MCPSGRLGSSSASPHTSGIMLTPVSTNPARAGSPPRRRDTLATSQRASTVPSASWRWATAGRPWRPRSPVCSPGLRNSPRRRSGIRPATTHAALLPGLGSLHLSDALLQEPAHEPPAGMLRRNGGAGHYASTPVGEARLAWVGRYPFMVSPGSIGYRRSRGQNLVRPPDLPVLQSRPNVSATSWATSDGFVAALMPASLSASLLASAVLSPPETMAPACPMVLPSGAVKPAM